jgi:multidrug resistance protein MdtO
MASANMASRATEIRYQPARRTIDWPWFREFIRWEVAPYPGRVNTVLRMTVAATLAMLIVVTFRIPNPFLAAFFSILIARENLAVTWRGGQIIVLAFVSASLYTLLGMMLFRGYPITHFFWVIGSLYLVFFVIRTATNYAAAAAFGVPIAIGLPIWDRSLPSEIQVENTLWLVLIIAVGAGITVGTEALYRIFDRSDPLIASVCDLLLPVQQLAKSIASRRAPPKAVLDRVLQYHMTGTGRLRMVLVRQGLAPTQRAQRSALISLAGRLIDLAANLMRTSTPPSEDDAIRLRALAEKLGAIRAELRESGVISSSASPVDGQPSSDFPVLQDMEQIIVLLTEVFQPSEIADDSKNKHGREWWHSLFVPDAFKNPEYMRFAFAGCLSASVCYMLYNALDWPGINTSVLTCIVTALSTIGSSLQAQFLRLAGFVVGGLILGISAQILIMPGIDTIFGFALFFAAATAIGAWFATSSPRLSYFGVQIALAFYFVHLQDYRIQTDLTIARDKVIGVLLGILAMGFIFDRFGTKSDAEQLQKLLVRNVRLLAQLGISSAGADKVIAISQFNLLRNQINDNFASLTTEIDSVQFENEFRHRREENVAEWDRIQRTQPALRSIYLLELSLFSHRGRRGHDSGLTQDQNLALDHFLNEFSHELTHLAAWLAREEDAPMRISDDSIVQLRQAFERDPSPNLRPLTDICQKMISSLLALRNQCELAF